MARSRLPLPVPFAVFAAVVLVVAAVAAGGAQGASQSKPNGAHPYGAAKRTGLAHARLAHRRRATVGRQLRVTTRSPAPGAVSGRVTWRVEVSGARPNRVEFAIDGDVKWTENESPYFYGGDGATLDTSQLAEGQHNLRATAFGPRGSRASSTVTVNVSNDQPSQPSQPPSEPGPLIFSDDFEGSAGNAPNPAKWVAMNWCDRWGSLSCNTNRTRNVALDGAGNLRVTAIREAWTDDYGNRGSWTSARVETQNKFKFTYGTLKARIKVPAGRGLWPSFWTTSYTKTGWPATGEIDVMEALGHEPRVYYCSVHGANGSGGHTPTTIRHTSADSLATGFHVYEAQWTQSQVRFYLDGDHCGTISTSGLKPFSAQQVLVGMAVGGGWPGNPDGSTPNSADMLVDWVRVYAP
jgi:beta-glucanase (GH16 family)